MFEHHSQPLLPRPRYYQRIGRHAIVAVAVLVASLLIGIFGYRGFAGLSWIDALENASMILSGMGPAAEIQTTSGKLFAAFYALFSGIVFLVAASVLLAPAVHRLLHTLHLEKSQPREK